MLDNDSVLMRSQSRQGRAVSRHFDALQIIGPIPTGGKDILSFTYGLKNFKFSIFVWNLIVDFGKNYSIFYFNVILKRN